MTYEEITKKLTEKINFAPDLKAKVKFDLGEKGIIFVDTTKTPATISQDDQGTADVTLSCSQETFEGLLNGSQDPNIAFMLGKLKVQGNMALALKLNAILED